MNLTYNHIRVSATIMARQSFAYKLVTPVFIQQVWDYRNYYNLPADTVTIVINENIVTIQYSYDFNNIYNQIVSRSTDYPLKTLIHAHMERLINLLPSGFETQTSTRIHETRSPNMILVPNIECVSPLIVPTINIGGGMLHLTRKYENECRFTCNISL